MPAITSLDLSNAKLDVDHIADIATSLNPTATDRLGHTKDTISGAVYKIASFTNKGVWAPSTNYQVKDLVSVIVSSVTTWYVCVVQHTSSSAFASDSSSKWRIYQGVTTGDLSAVTGTSLIGVREGQTLGDIFSKIYVATDYDDITNILTATTGPVTIRLMSGKYKAPARELTFKRNGITIFGDVYPRMSASGDRMENGSVVEGTLFFSGCNSGSLYNFGVDRGLYVTNNLFAGVRSDALVVTCVSDGPLADSPEINNWFVSNVRGLTPINSMETPSLGHAVLLEGLNGSTCVIGNLEGDGGSSAVAIKCKNIKIGNITGSRGFPYTIVLKSNSYAKFSDVQTGVLTSRDGGGIAIVSDDTTVGYALSRLQIEGFFATNCQWGLRTDSASGQPISDVHIGFATGRGITGTGLHIKGANTNRITVCTHAFEGCNMGVLVNEGASDVHIGEGTVFGSTTNGYFIDASVVTAGHIKSTYNMGVGVVTHAPDFCCDSFIANNNTGGNYGGPYVPCTLAASDFFYASLSTGMTSPTPISLSNSAKFIFSFVNGDISRSGGGSINAGTELCIVPSALRPISVKLIPVGALLVGGAFSVQPMTISNADGIATYRGEPATTIYLGGNSFDRR